MKYHQMQITQLQFHNEFLISSSWDQTLKLCQIYSADKPVQTIIEQSEVLGFAIPLTTFCADGSINFYDGEDQIDYLNVRRFSQQGRLKKVFDSEKLSMIAYNKQFLVAAA